MRLLWERMKIVVEPSGAVSYAGVLAHPERFGGDVEDAFDVIAPSLPGFGS